MTASAARAVAPQKPTASARLPTRQTRQSGRAPSAEAVKRVQAKKIILDTLSKGFSITLACQKADIPRSLSYQWRDADPEFRQAWDEANEAGLDTVEDFIRGAASKDWRAGEAMAKAKRPSVWGARVRTDNTTTTTVNATVAADVAVTVSGPPAAWLAGLLNGPSEGEV